jgi:uncharacterized protein (TIGR03067 family)
MRRARILLLAVSVALLGFAPAPLPRQQRHREDQADVAGTWRFVLWERDGARRQEFEAEYRVRMTREEFALVGVRGEETGSAFVLRLEPTASPPAFTLRRNNSGRFVGIYRLQGDQITMTFNGGDRPEHRPTDVAGKAEYRFVLRRIGR